MKTRSDWAGVVQNAVSWQAFECRLSDIDSLQIPDLLLESPMMARAAKRIIEVRPELKPVVQVCIESLMIQGGVQCSES
jgi:hypothetical protein